MMSLVQMRRWLAWDRYLPVWYDPDYRLPLSAFGKRTGLDPRRADLVAWYLLDRGWLARENLRTPTRVRYEDLARVHTPDYLESLADPAALARVFGVDPWGVPVDELLNCVRLGCGGTLAAARAALEREGPAVNLMGGFHHAGPNWGAGLCALNDLAVAIATLRHEGLAGQAVVLDLDAHPPDGTAACLRDDRRAWVGSLSGSSSGIIPGADETVLPPHCGDEEYLDALERLLRRMPEPDLAFVIAGGDVLAGDHLGHLGLSEDGARRRDLRVAEALRGRASVWLPGGGYHSRAWRVLAGTVLALSHRTQAAISEGRDPMAARFARLARYIDAAPARVVPELSFEDVEVELGLKAAVEPKVLLGVYTLEGLEYALFRFGILTFLERRGYGSLRVTFGAGSSGGERVTVLGDANGQTHTLIECVMERQVLDGQPALYVHWLSLRDPRARFSDRRPPLPGQDAPGLGLAREITEMILLAAERVGADGVAFTPAWFHTAYLVRDRFRFVDPERQGQFEAMTRDLAPRGLDVATRALADGRVECGGQPVAWQPALMATWVRHEGEAAERVAAERDRCRYTVTGSEAGTPA
jgi:acetoin utilization deacetylase AcuC-like enzyme